MDYGVLTELGKALIIAFVLGVTIEPWMRKALARDVFSAAFGYDMPIDFKEEIARIAGHRIICRRHIMDVRIRHQDNDSVLITVTVEREFTNIGASPVLRKAFTRVDEWGFSEPTRISRCEIFAINRIRTKKFDKARTKYYPNLSFEAQSPRMILLPKQGIGTIIEYNVVRRKNDFIYEQFAVPTRNPEIRIIEKPDDIDAVADLGAAS